MKPTRFLLIVCAVWYVWQTPPLRSQTFDFNDGTTQNWTLSQMYVTATQVQFTPVIGYSLGNSGSALSASSGSLLIGSSEQNDIYLESPDLSSNSQWQGIAGYSIDVTRLLHSHCWGDFANIFYVQLQLKVIDTGDGNKEKLYAEYSGSTFVFHDIETYDHLYQFTWTPSWLSDPRYVIKNIRIRITGPGDVMAECWYHGSWEIDNVTAEGGSGTTESITVTNPNGGEQWEAETPHSISWTGQEIDNKDVKIEYSTNGGSSYTFVTYVTNHGTAGSYAWTVPNAPSANCFVRLSTTAVSDVSDEAFEITATPSVTLDVPNGGEEWAAGSPHYIVWHTHLFDDPIKLEYSTDGGAHFTSITNSYAGAPSYEWTVPDAPSTNCLIRVAAAADGDPSDVSDAAFEISSTIQANTPVGNNVLVQPSGSIALLFDTVLTKGNTEAAIAPTGPVPPSGAVIVPEGNPAYYQITTSAGFAGKVRLTFTYEDDGLGEHEASLKMMSFEGGTGTWQDITAELDIDANTIAGISDHLSTFAVMYSPSPTAGGKILVTTCADTGEGSLRKALTTANAHPGPDTILFAIPPGDPGHNAVAGIWTIMPEQDLPQIVDGDLTIDGFSQAAFVGSDANPLGPEIVIDGSNDISSYTGLLIQANNVSVSGLTVNNFHNGGIFVQRAEGVRIHGCYVGTNHAGDAAAPNGYGIIVYDASRFVSIAPADTVPCIISGNKNGGVFVRDTSRHVSIAGNIIGLDRARLAPLGNGNYGGVVIEDDADSAEVLDNIIGANKFGIHMYDAHRNSVQNNWIGKTPANPYADDLGNDYDGIFIGGTSTNNQIVQNVIAFNQSCGVRLYGTECSGTRISQNSIARNASVGIEYDNGGVVVVPKPVILNVTAGEVTGTAPPNASVEIYCDSTEQGECYEGQTTSDAAGAFTWLGTIKGPFDHITAIAIDQAGNTSPFSQPFDRTAVGVSGGRMVSGAFTLEQNFPNPFNPTTVIRAQWTGDNRVRLVVYDVLGREVAVVADGRYPAGAYSFTFDATGLPSGVLFYRLTAGGYTATRAMVLMK